VVVPAFIELQFAIPGTRGRVLEYDCLTEVEGGQGKSFLILRTPNSMTWTMQEVSCRHGMNPPPPLLLQSHTKCNYIVRVM